MMFLIVTDFPVTKLGNGLHYLYLADEAIVSWLHIMHMMSTADGDARVHCCQV